MHYVSSLRPEDGRWPEDCPLKTHQRVPPTANRSNGVQVDYRLTQDFCDSIGDHITSLIKRIKKKSFYFIIFFHHDAMINSIKIYLKYISIKPFKTFDSKKITTEYRSEKLFLIIYKLLNINIIQTWAFEPGEGQI